ncbi:nuclear transport factor 2 family protein [Pseudoduganella sp. LjRoot289]|uniref:nuclear transport factor 2 family protein n=1 Tax=Pseudoduganella sp. LjRoot289 TaxID=3342314 RepID=UPI003ECE89DE
MNKPIYVQEYKAVVEVLNQYIEGCQLASGSIMKPAFSEQATIFGIGADGKLSGGAIQGLFDAIDSDFRASPEARSVIASIDIAGTAASARIDSNDVSGFCFTDFFNLLKVEGKWTVVSKIYHTHVMP